MGATGEQVAEARSALKFHQAHRQHLQGEAAKLRRALQLTEGQIAQLLSGAETAAQEEAALRLWLKDPQGLPPHAGSPVRPPAANGGGGGVARRPNDESSDDGAEYYSDGLEGEEHIEHGADALPPGALQHRAKERAQQEKRAAAEPTPDQPPAFFVLRSVAVKGGSGSSDAGSSPRSARRAPGGGSLFGAAFAGLARDRNLPARPPARAVHTPQAPAGGGQGVGSTGNANGIHDSDAAEPRRPGMQYSAGRAPPGFNGGPEAGGSEEAPPPGLRGRLGATLPPGFDAPRSSSRHDDRVGGQPEGQRPQGYGGWQGGQDAGNEARGGWRDARQPEPPRRHPAEGLRSAVRDAAGNVMGVSGGGPASSSRPAASPGNGPALSPAAAAFAPGAPAARPDRQLYQTQLPKQSSTPPPPPPPRQSPPSLPQQQQQQDSPPPPPGLAQQHSALLPAADMSEDDTPAAPDLQDAPAPQAMDSAPAPANGASSIGGAGSGSMDSDAAPLPHMNGSTATGEGPEAQQQAGSHSGSDAAKASVAAATAPASEDGAGGATNVEVSATAAQEAAPPGALQMPAMAQARTVTHDPFDGAERQRPGSAASGGTAKRSWADELYEDNAPLPPLPGADDFPSLGGGGGGGSVAGAWGNASQLKTSLAADAAKGMTRLKPSRPAPPMDAEVQAQEHEAQLRIAGDDAPDIERRKQAHILALPLSWLAGDAYKHVEAMRNFEGEETIRGRRVNVLAGLKLHKRLLSGPEERQMVEHIRSWVAAGKRGELRGRTFSAPRKWMPGKGRITCQFGCCYNYAVDSQGRPKGIIAEEVVEPMPAVLRALCQRLVRWRILPPDREPDTAIVNVYDTGDCIPPHIDHHDFVRPFVTVSLQSEQEILFSERIISLDAGVFSGRFKMPLPPGSCLVLQGNGADVAQHCIPPVSQPRMSLTLRCMAPNHAARVAAEAKAVLEGGGALSSGRDGDRSRAVQALPRGSRAWLSGADAVAEDDRSGMDADRWTSRVPDNDGWGDVRLTAAKPRRK